MYRSRCLRCVDYWFDGWLRPPPVRVARAQFALSCLSKKWRSSASDSAFRHASPNKYGEILPSAHRALRGVIVTLPPAARNRVEEIAKLGIK